MRGTSNFTGNSLFARSRYVLFRDIQHALVCGWKTKVEGKKSIRRQNFAAKKAKKDSVTQPLSVLAPLPFRFHLYRGYPSTVIPFTPGTLSRTHARAHTSTHTIRIISLSIRPSLPHTIHLSRSLTPTCSQTHSLSLSHSLFGRRVPALSVFPRPVPTTPFQAVSRRACPYMTRIFSCPKLYSNKWHLQNNRKLKKKTFSLNIIY